MPEVREFLRLHIKLKDFSARVRLLVRRNTFQDILVLLSLNTVFASRYLSSSSNEIPGFPFRMDGYSYPLFARLFIDLLQNGIAPLGDVWVPQVAAGHSFFIIPDPLFTAYSTILVATGNFIAAYKILLFLLYFASGVSSYYFASILLSGRTARLVSSTCYTFSQTTMYEVSLGHLSIVYGMVLMPLIIGFVLKGYRNSRVDLSALAGILLFFLIIEREDYGYMMIGFVLLLFLYHLFFRKGIVKSVISSTTLTLSAALFLSAPYLQAEIFSKLSLWERVGTNYGAYSPSLLQLFAPIFSNVEAYLGNITIILVGICIIGLLRHIRPPSFKYENNFFVMFSLVACLFVILGLGSSTPIYGALYRTLPSFTGFRAAAGNPTYWIQPSKLCLSVLAGGGCAFLATTRLGLGRISLRLRRTLVVILILAIVLDGGTFLAASEPYSPIIGWSSISPGPWQYNVYQFIQAAPVPAGAPIYKYIAKDPSVYNVIEMPNIYTLPDFQYLTYLRNTQSTVLNPYGVPDIPRIFSEIYSSQLAVSASAGNASLLASDLALLGVKYLVYEGSWGGPYVERGLRQSTTPFEFIMQDGNVSLFRNLFFGLDYKLPNLVQDPSFDTPNSSIWQPWNVNDTYNCVYACFDSGVSFDGMNSLKETAPNSNSIAGRNQFINASSLSPGRYLLSGWSKAVNVSTGSEYGIRVTGTYENGTIATLAYAPFETGTHDWQYSQGILSIDSTENLTELAVSLYLRSGTGTAWVDDLAVQRLQPADNWNGAYAVRSIYGDSSSTTAQQNIVEPILRWTRTNQMEMELTVGLGQPAFLILPISYDPGWIIRSTSTGESLKVSEYEGLMKIQLGSGAHTLLMRYGAYQDSVYETSVVYLVGIAVCTLTVLLARLRFRQQGYLEESPLPNVQSARKTKRSANRIGIRFVKQFSWRR